MLRKIRKMLKHQEGFTLVELMIVVVILGILAGVGIQQYGNVQAKAEINSIMTVTLQQPLLARLQINNMLGNARTVGLDEELRFEYYQIQADELSRVQASSGAFVFPTLKKRTETATTRTATGGLIIDYRELASGAIDGFANAAEQIVTDIFNQVTLSGITALETAIQGASTLKNYAAGITKSNVDSVLKLVRRFGNVTIMGDYSAVSEINDIAGFNIGSTASVNEVRFSEAVMEEIRRTGLVRSYKGVPVVEIPNSYNLTQLNTAGNFYDPYLPQTDLWFIPQGYVTPLQIVYRGGLTSLTATDINLRAEVTRWDLEYGNKVITEYIPFVGYIYDLSLNE